MNDYMVERCRSIVCPADRCPLSLHIEPYAPLYICASWVWSILSYALTSSPRALTLELCVNPTAWSWWPSIPAGQGRGGVGRPDEGWGYLPGQYPLSMETWPFRLSGIAVCE